MHLRAELMRPEPSQDGLQADVLFIEPNGAEHQIRCLVRPDGAIDLGELGGFKGLPHLEEMYGSEVICALAESVVRRAYL